MRGIPHKCLKNHKKYSWWMWLLVIGIVAACLLSNSMPAHAFPATQCAAGRSGSDLVCGANDVAITNMRIVGDTTSCIGGTNITVDLEMTVNFQNPARYDVGIFISNDGKSPQFLPPSGAASCSVSVLPTSSPFLNLDADACGDGQNSLGGIAYMTNVTVSCQAVSGSGGNLYIPFLSSWHNNTGAVCTSAADAVPGTSSKCNVPAIAQGTISVVVLPTITNTDGITTISSGGNTNYTVVITNTTGDTLSNAVFKDPAVTNITVNSVSCSPAGGASCPGSTTIAGMQGAGLTIPSMPANSTVTFTINATLTGTPPNTLTNTASVTVGSQTLSASDTDTIVGAIAILPTSSSKYGSPGILVVHNYTLYNFSGSPATINLSASSNQVPPWTVQLSASSVTLNSGESVNFTVTVTAGAIGTVDVTTITAISGSNSATATAVTTVSDPLTLTPNNTGAGGTSSSVFYDHRVQNSTASSQTVTFSTVFSGICTGVWTAIPPATVTLAAFGGYKDIVVQVNIPSGALLTDVCIATTTASAGTTASATDTTRVKNLVLYSSGSYTDESYIFPVGNDVYARAYGTSSGITYKFCWYDLNNALKRTSPPYTGPGMLSDTYLTLPNTPLGKWWVEVQQKSAAQACNPAPNSTYFAQTNFYVGPDHLNASYTYTGSNPSAGSNVTIPITLHDRYNHVVPLDPSSGNVVQGNPPTTKDPLKITVTVSGSATITEYCNPSCVSITPAQTVTFNLPATGTTKGTATITITDTAKETVTITPSSYNSALYGSSLTPTRDESTTVTFVRRKMKILDWREVQ